LVTKQAQVVCLKGCEVPRLFGQVVGNKAGYDECKEPSPVDPEKSNQDCGHDDRNPPGKPGRGFWAHVPDLDLRALHEEQANQNEVDPDQVELVECQGMRADFPYQFFAVLDLGGHTYGFAAVEINILLSAALILVEDGATSWARKRPAARARGPKGTKTGKA